LTAESEIGPLTRPLRTMIVDDEPLAIARMQILCAREPRLALVGTATHGASALRLVAGLAPDPLLLDLAMPRLHGMVEATHGGTRHFHPAVIFFPSFEGFP